MVYTPIDHKNGVKMFRNQVEPQTTAPFFTITLAIFNVHFLWIFSRAKDREKERYRCVISISLKLYLVL